MIKTIVITGAGSGMGRATAEVMSQDPQCRLILVGRQAHALEETKSNLQNKEQHILLPLDIRIGSDWKKALKLIDAQSLNISAVFANAGVGGENHYGDHDRWSEIISTNLDGTYVTIMELLPYLQSSKQEFRHILITSSCLGRFGVPNYTAYCTAKTGLLGLTKSLAVQYAKDHILVNAICPGWVETEMAKAGIQKLADRSEITYAESFKEQMSYVPLNKITKPIEIAKFVRFMFSDEQVSMTGQGIDINNGSFMI